MRNWIKQLFPAPKRTDNPPDAASPESLAPPMPADESVSHKEQGDVHLRDGNFEAAVQSYRLALDANPEYAKAHCNLGYALKELGLFEDAEQCLVRALSIDQSIADAHYLLGTLLQASNRPDAACTHLRHALERSPDFEFVRAELTHLLFQRGRPDEAKQILNQGIANNPLNADLHYYMGNLYYENRELESAIDSFQKALAITPDRPEILTNLGLALLDKGDPKQAVTVLQKAIRLDPNVSQVHMNLGSALFELGRYEESIASHRSALRLNPTFVDAQFNLGTVLRKIGRTEEAANSFRLALANTSDNAAINLKLGHALLDLGLLDSAVTAFAKTLEKDRESADACIGLGLSQRNLGHSDQAAFHFRRAIELKPDLAEAYDYLAQLLLKLHRQGQAAKQFRHILAINPASIEASYNLATTLLTLHEYDEAFTRFEQTLAMKPDYAEAYNNFGSYLSEIGKLSDSITNYRRALLIDPSMFWVHSNLLFTWNFVPNLSGTELLAEARQFGEAVAREAHPYHDWPNVPAIDRRLRVGFVSGDFRSHPVGFFIEGILAVLKSHAFDRLELVAYCTAPGADPVTERIKNHFSRWHPVYSLSAEELARLIRDDGIDILIDLSGHSAHNRLPTFAWKPASVQVSWLGYFATTGVKSIDYLIADPWTLPESEEIHFTEKIWRLPDSRLCFTTPDVDVAVSTLPALSSGKITFGCFNNLSKMNDEVVATWSGILRSVQGSRLFLKAKQLSGAKSRETVCELFAQHGIDANRLILEGYAQRSDYFLAYNRVDIALDPFPYPGGTTTVEALWMGVPVLTMSGEHFLSRQGLGLLMNAGLPDWIASGTDDYVKRACAHAGNLQGLSELRGKLRQHVLSSPLFDAPRFARHFETALRAMWVQWCNQQIGDRLTAETHKSAIS